MSLINNASNVGLLVIVTSLLPDGQNSGAYRNITVQYPNCSTCGASPIGIELLGSDAGTIVRGLEGITVSGCALNSGLGSTMYGILVSSASTRIAAANIECFQTGIQVGDGSSTTHNVQIDNAFIRCTLTSADGCTDQNFTGKGIVLTYGSANVSLSNISGVDVHGNPLAILVQDNRSTPSMTLGGSNYKFVPSYFLGDANTPNCTQNCLGLLSAAPTVTWIVPGGFTP